MKMRALVALMLIVMLQALISLPAVKAIPHTDIDVDIAYTTQGR